METTPNNTATEAQSDPLAHLPYQEEPDYLRAQRLWIYGSPIILVLGTIGNVLSLLVMMRKSLRSRTTSLYLVVLTVVDTLALYTGLLANWITALSGLDVRTFSIAGCKFFFFFSYFLRKLEPWILVSVTAERLAAIFVPLKAKSIFTRKFASIQLIITALILTGVYFHLFWTFTKDERGMCTISLKYLDFFMSTWGWLDFCLASLIPFALMIGSNVAIIGKFAYLRRLREKKLNTKDGTKMTSMTAILLVVSFTFFLTTAPVSIFLSTQSIWFSRAQTPADFARMDLVWVSVSILSYTNYAINFLLYCISGPRFRVELTRMFHCAKVEPIMTETS